MWVSAFCVARAPLLGHRTQIGGGFGLVDAVRRLILRQSGLIVGNRGARRHTLSARGWRSHQQPGDKQGTSAPNGAKYASCCCCQAISLD